MILTWSMIQLPPASKPRRAEADVAFIAGFELLPLVNRIHAPSGKPIPPKERIFSARALGRHGRAGWIVPHFFQKIFASIDGWRKIRPNTKSKARLSAG
jgi:hypothetical protein